MYFAFEFKGVKNTFGGLFSLSKVLTIKLNILKKFNICSTYIWHVNH